MHGMWGSPEHLEHLANGLKSQCGSDTIVHNCTSNKFFNTYQGIDLCGFRVYLEVLQVVKSHNSNYTNNKINCISFIGYSAGGLFNRYCIALLHRNDFFINIKPLHFITIATPHIGVRNSSRNPVGKVMNFTADRLVYLHAGRTGKQIMLIDDSTNPLLLQMSKPNSIYINALSMFEHVYFYANATNDNTVSYCTSSLSTTNKYKNKNILQDAINNETLKYKAIISCEVVNGDSSNVVVEQREYGICSVINAIAIILFLLPLVIIHSIIFGIPLRLVSLCYSTPDLGDERLIEKCVVNVSDCDRATLPSDILTNLKSITKPIYRVDVYIPAIHTHGKIVNRFTQNESGIEVMNHLIEEVLSMKSPMPDSSSDISSTSITLHVDNNKVEL
jgi:hypothetical protein